jgi:hypothetical protein
MESTDKTYYGSRKRPLLGLLLTFIAFVILIFYRRFALHSLGIPSHYNSSFSLAIGMFTVIAYTYFFRSLIKPEMRICDHFLMMNCDWVVLRWDEITSVRMPKPYIIEVTTSGRKYKKNLRSVFKKEEVLRQVEDICKSKGIPFERKEEKDQVSKF